MKEILRLALAHTLRPLLGGDANWSRRQQEACRVWSASTSRNPMNLHIVSHWRQLSVLSLCVLPSAPIPHIYLNYLRVSRGRWLDVERASGLPYLAVEFTLRYA